MTAALAFLSANWPALSLVAIGWAIAIAVLVIFTHAAEVIRHAPTHDDPSRDSRRGGSNLHHNRSYDV